MGSELGPAARKKKRQDEADDVQLCEIGRRAIVKDGSPPVRGNLCLTENFFIETDSNHLDFS